MIDDSRRLDQIEALYLSLPDPSGVRIHAHLSRRGPAPGCSCGLGAGCDHGPPLWSAPSGEPYSLRVVQLWVQKVRGRLKARATADREERRALALARLDEAVRLALENRSAKDLTAAAARAADLDGSHVAAEEAQRPGVVARVLMLASSLVDYRPSEAAPDPAPSAPPGVVRFNLERLERLLMAADDGSARYRALGEPTKMTEAERLAWRRDVLDEAILQAVTGPASPHQKRETIIRAAGTASMITEGADLAERVVSLEKKIGG